MHHQQAIDMATNYLSHGKDENLKKMAQEMMIKTKVRLRELRTGRTLTNKIKLLF